MKSGRSDDLKSGRFYEDNVIASSQSMGISPGIVIGRLQREKNPIQPAQLIESQVQAR